MTIFKDVRVILISDVPAKFVSKNDIEESVGDFLQRQHNGNVVRFNSSKNWNQHKLSSGSMPPHPNLFV